MLLIARKGVAASVTFAAPEFDTRQSPKQRRSGELRALPIRRHERSALLGAVARLDLLLRAVLGRRVLDHRVEDAAIGGVVVGDDLPLLAVPLLDAGLVRALVILAGELHWRDHALEAELLDARLGQ